MTTATKYKTYPKYKPSGIDWLGDIPIDWNINYIKNLGYFASSGIDKKIVEGEPLIQMVNYTDIYGNITRVINANKELMTVSCPAWKISEANLVRGDLVFTPSSETTEDIGLSAVINENLENTVFSYHVIRFRFLDDFNHEFKKYWCNNTFVWQQFSSFAKGTTRQILDRNDFRNTQVVIPPVDEQKKIADFLDRETAKIDEMVAKKKKMTELLKEKRQALITHAVTKGLDPKAKMKPSGIDWLGDIPDGWEAKRLRFLIALQKGRKPEENTESVDGLPYLTMDFLRGQEDPTKYTPSQESVLVDDKEILLLWDGANAGEFMEGSKGILSSTMAKVSFDKCKLDSKYYFYFLKSFEKKLRELTIGMGIPHVNGDIVKDCITPIPSDLEQKSIVDFLDRETAKIDEMMKKVETQIEKLQEYRQALIASAVTGKIMVN